MKSTTLARRFLLAGFVIVVPLAFLAARGLESEASVRARIGSILATLAVPPDCSSGCSDDWQQDYHENHAEPNGGFGGSRHGCGFNTLSCGWHAGFCHVEGPVMGELQKLIPSLDGDGIRYFVESTEAFTLNLDRRAVQILGCGGKVVLSMNLTPEQELELITLDN